MEPQIFCSGTHVQSGGFSFATLTSSVPIELGAHKEAHISSSPRGYGSGEREGQETSQTEKFKSVETLLRLDASDVAVWPK